MREILRERSPDYVYGAWSAPEEPKGVIIVYSAEPPAEQLSEPLSVRPARSQRERSGVAYAAGYAGVLYLFRYSFAPLVLSEWVSLRVLGMGFVLLLSLLGPVALVLSLVAGWKLDRSPEKYGRPQALFGFFVGWLGVAAWIAVLDERWLRSLLPF